MPSLSAKAMWKVYVPATVGVQVKRWLASLRKSKPPFATEPSSLAWAFETAVEVAEQVRAPGPESWTTDAVPVAVLPVMPKSDAVS